MTINDTFKVSLIYLLFVFSSCGDNSSSDATDTSKELAADGLAEVADAAADTGSNSTSQILTNSFNPNALSISKTCTQNSTTTPNTVTVDITLSGTHEKTFDGPKLDINSSMSHEGTISRLWSHSTQSLNCGGSGNDSAAISWSDSNNINGLLCSETVDITRTVDSKRTLTVRGSSSESLVKRVIKSTGTRLTTFSALDDVNSSLIRQRSTNTDMTRVITVTKDTVISTFTTTSKTKENSPLVVQVARENITPFDLQTKTIKSGTLINTRTDVGDRVELTFADVVYDYSSDEVCLPTSGTITGNYFSNADATTASKTFTITFTTDADSGATMTIDGTTVDFEFSYQGCQLEQEKP